MSKVLMIPALLLVACGGGGAKGGGDGNKGPANKADPNAQYDALEEGADYAQWTQMNTEKFFSKPHGKRMVDVYVNDIGVEAFKDKEKPFPVGSVIVKPSFETKDKVLTGDAGPVFVMVKKEAGFDPDNEDWWHALHWAEVPASWQSKMGGTEIYWRSPSKKVGYCGGCHQDYNRAVGGVPKKFRNWVDEPPAEGESASDGAAK